MKLKVQRPPPTPLYLNVISELGIEVKEIHIFFNSANEFATKGQLANMHSTWRNFFSSLKSGDSIFGRLLQDYGGYKSVFVLHKEVALSFHGLEWNSLRDEITRKTNMKVLPPTNSKRITHLLQAEYVTMDNVDYPIVSSPSECSVGPSTSEYTFSEDEILNFPLESPSLLDNYTHILQEVEEVHPQTETAPREEMNIDEYLGYFQSEIPTFSDYYSWNDEMPATSHLPFYY